MDNPESSPGTIRASIDASMTSVNALLAHAARACRAILSTHRTAKPEISMVDRRLVLQTLAVAALVLGETRRPLAQGTVQTRPIDPFGQAITLAEQTIVYASGTGEWETAYETLKAAFRAAEA